MTAQKIDHGKFTKYERTRILGARALQIAMDAPLLTVINKEDLEEINYDPMEIAKIEFERDVLPITVKQPMPKRKSVRVRKVTETKEETEEGEVIEEKEIIEEGSEIMELATPEDEETFEEGAGGRESSEELQ
jgi:DNA-directed RNA polymerase subunit K